MNTECGGNVTGLSNGVIHSPKFPEKYAQTNDNNAKNIQCHWFINVTPGHRILLYFETFEVEGNPAGIYLIKFFNLLNSLKRVFKLLVGSTILYLL